MYNPQLDTFIRVADAGSFNKAAEELYITPTAIIKQINLLEASLDVKLFERTHRGLHLTKGVEIFVLLPILLLTGSNYMLYSALICHNL